MKFLRRTLVVFFIFAFLALVVLGLYLQLNGKELAQESLSRVLKRPVHVRQAGFLLRLGLGLYDCEVEGLLKAKAINIYLRLPLVFNQQLLISRLELVDPLIFVTRNKEAKFVTQPAPPLETSVSLSSSASPVAGQDAPRGNSLIEGIFVHQLEIKNGRIQYADQSMEKDYKIRLEDLVLKATEISYPLKPVKSLFRFMVVIQGEEIAFAGSKITGDGWINLGKKDLNGKVEALLPGGDKWLQVNLISQNNDMTVEGKVDINQVINTNRDQKNVSLQDFVFGALRSSGLRVGLGFKFNTQMDAFKVDSVSLSGDVRQEAPGGESKTLSENLKELGERLTGTPDNANAIGPVDGSAAPAANAAVPLAQ